MFTVRKILGGWLLTVVRTTVLAVVTRTVLAVVRTTVLAVVRTTVLAVVTVMVSAGLASCASRAAQGPPTTGGSTSPVPVVAGASLSPDQRLWALAASMASANGGTVLMAQAVHSTRALAVKKIMQAEEPGDQQVWVIQVEGARSFRCTQCSVPAGAGTPRGRYLTVVVDAKTLQRLDFGIGPARADLGRLGRVITLHR